MLRDTGQLADQKPARQFSEIFAQSTDEDFQGCATGTSAVTDEVGAVAGRAQGDGAPDACERAPTMTDLPSDTSFWAVAKPRPRLAPVTRTHKLEDMVALREQRMSGSGRMQATGLRSISKGWRRRRDEQLVAAASIALKSRYMQRTCWGCVQEQNYDRCICCVRYILPFFFS